jgi:4-diphosphocytidyl-2-C-methyl-D-erythritol kinase
MLSETAPAKINLFLHVLGRRADGYHCIESLVSFADIGDRLELKPGRVSSLAVEGPFSEGLEGEGNLVLKAARLFAAHMRSAVLGAFRLTKNLPVASGIGGGSSDAAAALRLLARANGLALTDPRLFDCAALLGADVPVCLEARPRLMRGIGHELGPALDARPVAAVLVNPGVAVETRAVFSALDLAPGARYAARAGESETGLPPLLGTRNDLAAPALSVAPVIAEALAALGRSEGNLLARMSGSGATCFGLFSNADRAQIAARGISMANPGWWVCACRIGVPE